MKHEPTRTPTESLDALVSTAVAAELQEVIARVVAQAIRSATAPVAVNAVSAPAPAAETTWMTPPEASRSTGVPLKTIRRFIQDRRIEARLRNCAMNPKQPKYLVNVHEVARVATIPTAPSYPAAKIASTHDAGARATVNEWLRGRVAAAR